ncbi:TPA: IS6 family transposase, partial [Salmonella enterica subsp. enterica]|nr:IS6 family transposase [Salmonella enterica]
MNPFKGRHFQRDIILWAVRWYWRNPSDLCPWHMDETYVK